jgi:hypothetical protein
MASEFVTRWIEERKPGARVRYLGPDEDDIHVWDLEFAEAEHTFRLGIPEQLVEDDALLSERLMELETQGWLDQAGEKDLWVLVAPAEVAEGPTLFGGRGAEQEGRRERRSPERA